jgi:hypothetical protein
MIMQSNWANMDINQLQHLYTACSRELEYKLLHGVSWHEVNETRRDVTELAIAIYHRLNPSAISIHPPAKQQRNH